MKHYFTYFDEFKGKELKIMKKFQGIEIIAEKSHNRFITRVRNLSYLNVNLKKLLKIWKNKFDTSGSLRES